MLSQRTVGRFQRVLTAFFTPVVYGIRAPLDRATFYNLLYQDGVQHEFLEFIGNQYDFHPSFILAMHEGEVIDRFNRELNWNYSVSQEMTRKIGDIYLLVFASVALRKFEQYDHRKPYLEEVSGFLESLRQDGYTYNNGNIYAANGAAVVPVTLNGTDSLLKPVSTQLTQTFVPVSSPTADPNIIENAKEQVAVKLVEPSKKKWSRGEKIGFWSLVAAVVLGIATLIATIASPEVRRFIHLDNGYPMSSEGKSLSTVLPTDKNQNAPQATISSEPPLPTSPSEKLGIRDNVTVVVHRATSHSGADTAMVATTGNGEQEITMGAAPKRLMFTPPGLVIDKTELPKNFEAGGQQITVVRYTSSGFVIDDHKHGDVRFTAYLVEGDSTHH